MEVAITLGFVLVVVASSWFAAVFLFRRKVAAPRRVDEYSLSVQETNGFHMIRLRMKTEDGEVSTFELEPVFGHVLSDELCSTSAMASASARRAHAAAT